MRYTPCMPYIYAHATIGLLTEKKVEKSAKNIITAHREAFLLGLLGPDPFFGDRLPPPLFTKHQKELGNRLHCENASVLFSNLLSLSKKNVARLAYTFGFLCHFALDYSVHGYIESRYRDNDHTRFEMRMDLPIRDHYGLEETMSSPANLYKVGANAPLGADELLAQLFSDLYGLRTNGVYFRSYNKWATVQQLAYDPNGKKLKLAKWLDRVAKKPDRLAGFLLTYDPADDRDLFNRAHAPWAAPWSPNEQHTESYFVLFDRAVDYAVSLVNAAAHAVLTDDTGELLGLIGSRTMNGTDDV